MVQNNHDQIKLNLAKLSKRGLELPQSKTKSKLDEKHIKYRDLNRTRTKIKLKPKFLVVK